MFPDLAAATADLHHILATTARPREMTKPVQDAEAAAASARGADRRGQAGRARVRAGADRPHQRRAAARRRAGLLPGQPRRSPRSTSPRPCCCSAMPGSGRRRPRRRRRRTGRGAGDQGRGRRAGRPSGARARPGELLSRRRAPRQPDPGDLGDDRAARLDHARDPSDARRSSRIWSAADERGKRISPAANERCGRKDGMSARCGYLLALALLAAGLHGLRAETASRSRPRRRCRPARARRRWRCAPRTAGFQSLTLDPAATSRDRAARRPMSAGSRWRWWWPATARPGCGSGSSDAALSLPDRARRRGRVRRRRDRAAAATILAECPARPAGSSRLACLSDLLRAAELGLAEAEAKAVRPRPVGHSARQAGRDRGAGRHQHRRLARLPRRRMRAPARRRSRAFDRPLPGLPRRPDPRAGPPAGRVSPGVRCRPDRAPAGHRKARAGRGAAGSPSSAASGICPGTALVLCSSTATFQVCAMALPRVGAPAGGDSCGRRRRLFAAGRAGRDRRRWPRSTPSCGPSTRFWPSITAASSS